MDIEFGIFKSVIDDIVLGKDNWLEWVIENKHSLVFECIDDVYDGYGPEFIIIDKGAINYDSLEKAQEHIMDNMRSISLSL